MHLLIKELKSASVFESSSSPPQIELLNKKHFEIQYLKDLFPYLFSDGNDD